MIGNDFHNIEVHPDELEALEKIKKAAQAYVDRVSGDPEQDIWDTEDGKPAEGAQRTSSDWAWKAYDDAKQKAFDDLRAALGEAVEN